MIQVRKMLSLVLALALTFTAMVIMPQAASAYPETPLPYRIHVSRSAQIVTVFRTSDGSVAEQFICSTGLASTPTVTGTFKLPKSRSDERKNWYAFSASTWAHYATRITGSYLFHSILYSRPATSSLNRVSWSKIGSRASHGCIRMTPKDAQWIAFNCAPGTVVRINDSKPKGPITKSSTIKKKLPSAKADGTLPGWEATLKPTPKPTDDDRPTLDVGIVGPYTKAMQNQLQSLGYYTGKVNGKFTAKTKTALAAFQTKYLKVNGSAAPSNTDGVGQKEWQLRVRDSKDKLNLTSTIRTLSLSRKGMSVKALRQRLFDLGYTSVTPTTKYDAHTRDAVNAFKRANGLKRDGKAEKKTQDLLYASTQKTLDTAYANVAKGLSVRKSASTKAALVVKIKFNAKVRIIKDYGTWQFVSTGKKFGYVQMKHLKPTIEG